MMSPTAIRFSPTKALFAELLSDLVDAATDYGMAVGTSVSERDLEKEERASRSLHDALAKAANAIQALNIPD